MNKPYVYIIQNKDKSHWYVGMRSANECPANEDTKYWGSSDYLDELIAQTGKENWTKTIIKEFDTWQEANEFEQLMIEFMWEWPGRVNKAVNGFVDHNDPQVKAKHRTGTKIGAQKRLQDPVSVANHKAAVQKRSQTSDWRENHLKALAKPFIATSITTGEEYYCESTRCEQAKALKLNSGQVSSCLNGKYKQHKGYTFRYA